MEMLITLVLVFANCASWDKRNANNRDSVALRFGLLIVALNLTAVC